MASPKPKGRWLKYTLLTLLVVVAVCGSLVAVDMQQAKRQREAVAALRNRAARVLYRWESHKVPEKPRTPEWLRNVLGDDFFSTVAIVDLFDTSLTQTDLGHIESLSGLRMLRLYRTTITASDKQRLQKALPNCEILEIRW